MKEIISRIKLLIKESWKNMLYLILGLSVLGSIIGPEKVTQISFIELFGSITIFFIVIFVICIIYALINK